MKSRNKGNRKYEKEEFYLFIIIYLPQGEKKMNTHNIYLYPQ